MNKPRDMLEFLRRTSGGETAPVQPESRLEKAPRVLVLRRTQVMVAAASVGMGLLLAFLLGMAVAGDGGQEPEYVIRAASFSSETVANSVKKQLERHGFGPVQVEADGGGSVVTVKADSRDVLERIRGIKDSRTGEAPFRDAALLRVR